MVMSDKRFAGAVLRVDLGAIRANYRLLQSMLGPRVRCAGVVKANAYGLGASRVAPALASEGCRDFFVAHLDEALALQPHLPEAARIYILNGLPFGAEAECASAGLIPVLNSAAQLASWAECARLLGTRLAAVIQVDTGMNRMGLSLREMAEVSRQNSAADAIDVKFVMSHLACADEPAHEANAAQSAAFNALRDFFPGVPRSLANSSGVFLGPDFHHDMVRPGAAVYGINPVPSQTNPMQPVVQLTAQVVQLRDVGPGDHIGYGWAHRAEKPSRLATLSIGYADGWHRAPGGVVYVGDTPLPLVGRVSMDSIIVDLGADGAAQVSPGSMIELIGEHQSIDMVASAMGTIGHDVLTGLGARFERHYIGAEGAAVLP